MKVDMKDVKLPGLEWGVHVVGKMTIVSKLNSKKQITHSVTLLENNLVEVEIMGTQVSSFPSKVKTPEEFSKIIFDTNMLKPCEGCDYGLKNETCQGFCSLKALRCKNCKGATRAYQKRQRRETKIKLRILANKDRKRQERYRLRKSKAKLKIKVSYTFETTPQSTST